MRLFVAAFLPLNIKKILRELQDQMQREIRSEVKWVEERNLHITLSFLGELSETKVGEIVGTLQKTLKNTKVVPVSLKQVVMISGARENEKIAVCLLSEGAQEIQTLSQRIQKKIGGLVSQPHVTLGRFKKNNTINSEIQAPTFFVKSVCLVESRLKKEGPVYNILGTIDLSL